jgi:hypothetical protein
MSLRRGRLYGPGAHGNRAHPPVTPKELAMTTAKYLAGRAIMLLGTLAAFAFVIDGGAKRW